MAKQTDTKMEAAELAISQIERQFGKGAIMRLGADTVYDVPSIPTGSLGLDIAIGVGGLPRGRVVEIFGPESSGKTTLALHVVASAQRNEGIAAFIDAEHALDPRWAKKLGVELETLVSEAIAADNEAVDLYRFTSVLTRNLPAEDRVRVVEQLWEIVFADGKVHEFEENLVWRVAELLGVARHDRLAMKFAVAKRQGVNKTED